MSYDNENFSSMCADANRIAAQLRGRQPLTLAVNLNKPPRGKRMRAYATGIPEKGGHLRAYKDGRIPEVLAFCHQFFQDNDQLPPQSCVAEHFDVCEQVAQKYMQWLAAEKHIERNAVGKWRFTRVAK